MTSLVEVTRENSLVTITLNDPPKRNALSLALQEELLQTLQALAIDNDCRALVLTGAGGHFCSGADVSSMAARKTLAGARARTGVFHRVARALAAHPKPVVAAVEGYAAGAGMSLACLADAVVGSASCKFVASFAKVGLLPDMGLLHSLPQRVGLAAAKRIFMQARPVSAEEALALGLIDQIADEGQALAAAQALALDLAGQAPLPLALFKSLYARGMPTLEQALAFEVDNQSALFLSEDHREGVKAFRDKRQPRFAGE